MLDDRFTTRKALDKTEKLKHNKPIIDLALDNYENEGYQVLTERIDPTFKAFAIDQIKLFMFAGHDTTSSTVSYVYHLLSKNPSALRAVRKEYDDILGSDIAQAPLVLAEDPHVLSRLHYSNAIIKETLRLFPPASTARKGEPGFFLEHEGMKYSTEGFMVGPLG